MLDESYIIKGLNALARASEQDFFRDGHRGAAVIAAYYLCHEQNLEPATQQGIAECLRTDLESNELFGPWPEETAEPELIKDILDRLAESVGIFRMVGHNVIFPSAALKAFRQVPYAITPLRVQGICRLIECFDSAEVEAFTETKGVPNFQDKDAMVEFVFREYLESLARFRGYGQGWAGHLLTFSHALIELLDMGYTHLAYAGQPALKTMISIIRRGPSKGDRRIPDHSPNRWTPMDAHYWAEKRAGLSGLGHAFKYPYSYYNLLSRLDNSGLREQCESESYKIF